MMYIHRFFYWMFRRIYSFLCGFSPGVYIQNFNHVHIGYGVHIASGVSIIARNHNVKDPDDLGIWDDVFIGDHSWLGANCVVLPGVHLGPHTVVGANCVVTKSFPDGWCVIVGIPGHKIRDINND